MDRPVSKVNRKLSVDVDKGRKIMAESLACVDHTECMDGAVQAASADGVQWQCDLDFSQQRPHNPTPSPGLGLVSWKSEQCWVPLLVPNVTHTVNYLYELISMVHMLCIALKLYPLRWVGRMAKIESAMCVSVRLSASPTHTCTYCLWALYNRLALACSPLRWVEIKFKTLARCGCLTTFTRVDTRSRMRSVS